MLNSLKNLFKKFPLCQKKLGILPFFEDFSLQKFFFLGELCKKNPFFVIAYDKANCQDIVSIVMTMESLDSSDAYVQRTRKQNQTY